MLEMNAHAKIALVIEGFPFLYSDAPPPAPTAPAPPAQQPSHDSSQESPAIEAPQELAPPKRRRRRQVDEQPIEEVEQEQQSTSPLNPVEPNEPTGEYQPSAQNTWPESSKSPTPSSEATASPAIWRLPGWII